MTGRDEKHLPIDVYDWLKVGNTCMADKNVGKIVNIEKETNSIFISPSIVSNPDRRVFRVDAITGKGRISFGVREQTGNADADTCVLTPLEIYGTLNARSAERMRCEIPCRCHIIPMSRESLEVEGVIEDISTLGLRVRIPEHDIGDFNGFGDVPCEIRCMLECGDGFHCDSQLYVMWGVLANLGKPKLENGDEKFLLLGLSLCDDVVIKHAIRAHMHYLKSKREKYQEERSKNAIGS